MALDQKVLERGRGVGHVTGSLVAAPEALVSPQGCVKPVWSTLTEGNVNGYEKEILTESKAYTSHRFGISH
jgi:hypothetical protein